MVRIGRYKGGMMRSWLGSPTMILLCCNCVVFLACQISGGNMSPLYAWGALTDHIRQGEVWRLVSAGFLHADISHLVSNMVSLFFLGSAIEYVFGSRRMWRIYMVSLLAGTCASCIVSMMLHGYIYPSVGASGAIFGLMGAYLILARSPRFPGVQIDAWLIMIIGYNILYSFSPGIDTWGHFGGLAGGIITSLVMMP